MPITVVLTSDRTSEFDVTEYMPYTSARHSAAYWHNEGVSLTSQAYKQLRGLREKRNTATPERFLNPTSCSF